MGAKNGAQIESKIGGAKIGLKIGSDFGRFVVGFGRLGRCNTGREGAGCGVVGVVVGWGVGWGWGVGKGREVGRGMGDGEGGRSRVRDGEGGQRRAEGGEGAGGMGAGGGFYSLF